MQKANIFSIVVSHVATLRDGASGRFSWLDLIFFFVLPLIVGGALALAGKLPENFFTLTVSVYSIFAALLISAQVALFTILTTLRSKTDDPIQKNVLVERNQKFARLLRDVNTNISYLILLAVVSITIYVVLDAASVGDFWEGFLSISLFSHFFLTLLMAIKRIYIAFDNGYRDFV